LNSNKKESDLQETSKTRENGSSKIKYKKKTNVCSIKAKVILHYVDKI